jgi:apolipoprotein N-acyltransferase
VLLALSFPRYGHPAVAWVALAPLLLALVRQSDAHSRRPLLLGLVAGAGYFGGTVYWTPAVMQTFGGLNWPLAVVVGGLLVAYLALFPAVFAAIVARLIRTLGVRALLLAPMVWVATELARRYILGGFPWVLLGSSQATATAIAQSASIVGVYGLSALLVLASSALVMAGAGRRRDRIVVPLCAGLLIGGLALWGQWRVGDGRLLRSGDPVRVALVQGNIRQEEKWSQASAAQIFDTYLALTRQAADRGATLIVWPESATPFLFEREEGGRALISQTVRSRRIYLLFGSDQFEAGTPPRYFNSAFLLNPAGAVAAVYRKMHLVPFGEYVPLKGLLFFASPLVEAVSDFSPGEQAVVLPIGRHTMSTAICYEVVYPDLVAAFVDRGSQLLSTITNDAWYGHSSAPYQHFEQATLRAVEQGRYLIRAANTGISGIVDPYGRVVTASRIFERTVVTGEARFLSERTIYGRTGDAFAISCALLTLLALAITWRRAVPDSR